MNKFLKASILCPMLVLGMSQASAAVFSSEQVISNQQFNFNKQQVLSYVDSAEVQNKLIELGVSPADAKQRIANMTAEDVMMEPSPRTKPPTMLDDPGMRWSAAASACTIVKFAICPSWRWIEALNKDRSA